MDREDKRTFKRYTNRSGFNLLFKGKPFKSEITDYSLGGIGAMLEDSPPVKEGDLIDLNITAPEMKTEGKIVWTKRLKSGLKIGIKKIGDLKGYLRDYELADTLTGLQRSTKTGILEVKSGTVLKKIYIKNGDMIFAASNRDEDRLGDILLREGKITSAQYDQSVEEMKNTGQRQGTALVRLGCLKPQELVRAVTHQVEEIIISLFALETGNFEFKERSLPTAETITLKLSAANLIYRGIKRIENFSNAGKNLPAMEAVLCLSSDPMKAFQDISLDMEGKTILSSVDGKTAIKNIIYLSKINNSEALKTIYALLSTGIIGIKIENGAPNGADISAEEIIGEPEAKIDTETVSAIEEMHKRYKDLGYYGALGIKRSATASEIKNAYYTAAKKFHPDRHFYLSSGELKGKLGDIFAYLTEAYTTLSNAEKRIIYDRRLFSKPEQKLSNEALARLKFKEGIAALENQNIAQAMELFGQAAYLNSLMAEYHYYYGITLNKLNRLKEASRAIERALKIDHLNADYSSEVGHIYLNLGLPGRAKSSFEKALKLSPSLERAKEGIAILNNQRT